jgi:S1-C subfamily serine protease
MTDTSFQGLPVKSCTPGSPAEKAGVLKGDIVVLANGQRIQTMPEYVAARGLRKDLLELTVLRGPRMLDFRIPLPG